MKVGILSMHRVINYGSFLQAYALKQLLIKDGADEVSFIDIKPGRELEGYELRSQRFHVKRLLKAFWPRNIYIRIVNKPQLKITQKNIQDYFYLLGIDEHIDTKYDLAVIGSDEVFNCCQKSPWGYTLQLYGDIPNAYHVISYAGSFGHTTIEQLEKRAIDKEIGRTMQKMYAISVRDDNSYNIVKRITGIEPQMHLDPVLAYGYQGEIEYAIPPAEKEYIIIYSYPGRIKKTKEIRAIRDFAKKAKKKLYSFTYYSWCDKTISPSSPLDVLRWFKGADYVITETFHGTIFSVITHRQFVTIIRPSNSNKLKSLLGTLDLTERGILTPNSLETIITKKINYEVVENAINKHRKETHDYLSKALQNSDIK